MPCGSHRKSNCGCFGFLHFSFPHSFALISFLLSQCSPSPQTCIFKDHLSTQPNAQTDFLLPIPQITDFIYQLSHAVSLSPPWIQPSHLPVYFLAGTQQLSEFDTESRKLPIIEIVIDVLVVCPHTFNVSILSLKQTNK